MKFQTNQQSTARRPKQTIITKLWVALGIALMASLTLIAGTETAAEAATPAALTMGDPADCPAPRTVKSYKGSSTGNRAEARYSPACDGIWVRISNNVAQNRYVFIVAYDSSQATGSCRSDYSERRMTKGGGWSRMLDVSDHAAFRVCWDDDLNAPFDACGTPFKVNEPRDFDS